MFECSTCGYTWGSQAAADECSVIDVVEARLARRTRSARS